MGKTVVVIVAMTNTSNQPSCVCVSSDLYQDLPKLKKDGRLVPYTRL